MDRIRSSVDDPLRLEQKGNAVFDLYPTRRGNLFSDEVYRLEKARDATTVFDSIGANQTSASGPSALPPNHKFSVNDVIVVTKQPQGSGDIFDPSALPISENAMTLEARVSGVGPTYIDIVAGPGAFEAAFGGAAPNDASGKGDRRLRVRADLFFSPIPYQRMVTALAQITQVPAPNAAKGALDDDEASTSNPLDRITMDKVIRDVILSTHAFGDRDSPFFHDPSICNLDEINNLIAKPPMPTSERLALQVLKFFQSSPQRFRPLNAPQSAAVQAALTRRLTLIQGPPGSGKTTVAGRIGAGFSRQCQSLNEHTKVLACAFSNVGADNLGEAFLALGLKVVRIGKPSAVSRSLWNNTIDAAISRDADAQKAMQKAALATAALTKQKNAPNGDDRMARAAATAAVKASIAACNLAATKAFREADIIVSTSTGAADQRLMAACGLSGGSEDDDWQTKLTTTESSRTMAPDGLPPISLPFVIIDEACQSVEPATLIPIVSSNSCRSLVLLGDPCQLPPTVRHAGSEASPLSVSLMERLSTILQSPNIYSKLDNTVFDTSFLESMPLRQARSLAHSRLKVNDQKSYRKRFGGSFMLSTQYRMHPSISAFPSAIFYDGLLSTPSNLSGMRPFPKVLQSLIPREQESDFNVRLVNMGGRCNEFISDRNVAGEQSTSYSNVSLLFFFGSDFYLALKSHRAVCDVETIACRSDVCERSCRGSLARSEWRSGEYCCGYSLQCAGSAYRKSFEPKSKLGGEHQFSINRNQFSGCFSGSRTRCNTFLCRPIKSRWQNRFFV